MDYLYIEKIVARCKLCLSDFDLEEWGTRTHQEECASSHREFLDGLPELFPDVSCPKCNERSLKLCPKDRILYFKCSRQYPGVCGMEGIPNEPYKERKRRYGREGLRNHGHDMLICFACDYNLCLKCCQEIRSKNTENSAEAIQQQPPENPEFTVHFSDETVPQKQTLDSLPPPPSYSEAVLDDSQS